MVCKPQSGFEMRFAIGLQHCWCPGSERPQRSQPKHASNHPGSVCRRPCMSKHLVYKVIIPHTKRMVVATWPIHADSLFKPRFVYAWFAVCRPLHWRAASHSHIISHNFAVLTTFLIFNAICMRNHRIIIVNVAHPWAASHSHIKSKWCTNIGIRGVFLSNLISGPSTRGARGPMWCLGSYSKHVSNPA